MAWDRVTVKHDGRYFEFPIDTIDVNPDNPTDEQIKTAMAGAIHAQLQDESPGSDPAVPDFSRFTVDPPQAERLSGQHANKTVLNLRPSASYGQPHPTVDG